MFNLANLILDEGKSEDNIQKSIKLLIDSSSYDIHSSMILLGLILIQKYNGINIKIIQNELRNNNNDNYEILAKIIYNRLYNPTERSLYYYSYDDLYEYYRNVDYLYSNYSNVLIIFQNIDLIEKHPDIDQSSLRKNINEDFYNGFLLES